MVDYNKIKGIFESFADQRSLTDAVFLAISEAINLRLFPDGTCLNSILLADVFDISRTPINTALIKLEFAGLLRYNRHSGFETYSFTFRERIDYNDCMLGIYDVAAKIAQKRVDAYYKSMLKTKLEQLSELQDNCYDYLHAETDFHYHIVLSTANNELIDTFRNLRRKYGLAYYNEDAVQTTPGFPAKHHLLNEQLYETLMNGAAADLDTISTRHNEQMREAICTWISSMQQTQGKL